MHCWVAVITFCKAYNVDDNDDDDDDDDDHDDDDNEHDDDDDNADDDDDDDDDDDNDDDDDIDDDDDDDDDDDNAWESHVLIMPGYANVPSFLLTVGSDLRLHWVWLFASRSGA